MCTYIIPKSKISRDILVTGTRSGQHPAWLKIGRFRVVKSGVRHDKRELCRSTTKGCPFGERQQLAVREGGHTLVEWDESRRIQGLCEPPPRLLSPKHRRDANWRLRGRWLKYLLPLASPASPLCPCNDPLLHPALIYAAFCVAISTTVHSNLSPTRAHSSYFPGLRAKLFNFFIRRETRETSCHGSFAGNGNCNGAGVLWSRRKKVCVCGVYQRLCDLLRSATSCGQKYAVEFFLLFLFFLFLPTIERRIRDNCRSFRRRDDLYRKTKNFLLYK